MRHFVLGVSTLLTALALAGSATAQESRAGSAPPAGRAGRAAGRAGAQQPLARELRQRFNATVQRQLNLSDENARRLEKVDRQFEQQRTQLRRDEREARLGLQAALADT